MSIVLHFLYLTYKTVGCKVYSITFDLLSDSMTKETTAKRGVQKLQRVILDALEKVKGQEIQVFDTEQQSSLFERVFVASGTSNRQTRALAAAVRDAVKGAGFDIPRVEGEENGEWVLVDCGSVVVHIMQPKVREYYRLEDLWGETPVKMRRETAAKNKEQAEGSASPARKTAVRKTATKSEVKAIDAATVVKKAAKKVAESTATTPAKTARKTATKTAAKAPAKTATKAVVKAAVESVKAAVKAKAPAKSASKPVAKTVKAAPVTKVVIGKPAAKKTVAAKKAVPAKKTVSKKA